MDYTPTPLLQTTGSADVAGIEAIHVALPHQRPQTPLGIFGKLPLEVRNQIYRDIFVQVKVHLKSQRPGPHLGVHHRVQVLQVLEVSKTLRFEGRYCLNRKTNTGADFVLNI